MKISNVKRKEMKRRNKQADELLNVNAKEIMEEARNTLGEAKRCLKKLKHRCDCDDFEDENYNCCDYRDNECVDPRELKCFGMSKRKYDLMSLRKLATQLLNEEVNLLPNFNTDIIKHTKMILDAIVNYIKFEDEEETEND